MRWLAGLFIAFAIPAHAVLDLEIVQRRAIENLPLIEEQEAKISAAKSRMQQADGAFDTTLKGKTSGQNADKYDYNFWEAKLEKQTSILGSKLYVGHRAGLGTWPAYYGDYQTSSVGEAFAGFSVPLLRGLLTDEFRTFKANAQREVFIEEQLRLQKVIDVLLKSSQAYWKWVATGQKYEIYQTLVKVAEDRQEYLEKKFQAGDIHRLKLTDNLRTLSKRKVDLQRAQIEWEMSLEDLNLYYRSSQSLTLDDVPKKIEENMNPLKADYLTLENKKKELPVFKILDLKIEILKQEASLAENKVLPKVDVFMEGIRDVGRVRFGKDQDELRMGMNFEFPLMNNQARGKRSEVKAKQLAVIKEKEWLDLEWNRQAKQFLTRLRILVDLLGNQKIEVDSTDKMAKAESVKLRQGQSDIFYVNIREEDLAEAKLKLVETLASLQIAQLELEALTLSFKNYK